ncbi:putative Ig domain-containing protein, partial [bacterium]|nr:putative Ig domain-containing protein [bacterium]
LQILPDSLDDGKAGVGYGGETLRVIGGEGPYSWSLYEGSLPFGMTLSPGGLISGTPKEAGEFTFTAKVTDFSGETDTQKFTLFIQLPNPITIEMKPKPAPNGIKYSNYSPNVSFTANGGILPYSWNLSGEPIGLGLTLISSDITGETMELTGAPQQAGDFPIIVTITDDFYPEGQVAFVNFNLCVKPLDLIIGTMPSPLPEGYLGSPYDATLSVINWEATPSWDVTGLPSGLGLSSPSGYSVMITGVPIYDPNVTYPKTYNIKVLVTDGFASSCYQRGWIEFPFTITIHPKQPVWSIEGVDGEAIAVATDSSGSVYVTGYTFGEGTGKDYYTVKYNAEETLVWDVPYNGPGNGDDVPSAIAVHDSGVYVTGTSFGNPTGDDFYTVKYDRSSGDVIWEDRYDGPSFLGDGGNDLALDIAGNAQVAGYVHRGNVTKHADYTTLKYSSSGGLIWDEGYDSTRNGNDVATAIAVDSEGNVYVTGKSQKSSKKDPTTHDYLTIKYDSSGEFQWFIREDGLGFGDDEPTAIALY